MVDWVLILLPLAAVPIVLLFRFVGCGELLSTTEVFHFDVAVDPPEITVTQGGTVTADVTITPRGGYNKDVRVETSPLAGWTLAISPDIVNPKAGQVVTKLTVTAPANAEVGESEITIKAEGPGATSSQPGSPPPANIKRTIPFTIDTIAAPPVTPDFSLSLTPPSLTVASGATATFIVTIDRVGGFAEEVELTAIPEGGTFNPGSTTGTSSTLTAVTTGAVAGTYAFTVFGTAASGTQRHADGTLIVT